MQRSIGAAVERLAVDLYASRWDGTPPGGMGRLLAVSVVSINVQREHRHSLEFARVRQGAFPARTHSESWQKQHRRVMVVLCCSDSQFFKSEASGPGFHLTVY